MKFLTRLRLDFSHLNDHRFRHNFQDCLIPLCPCSLHTKETKHYLHCHHFSQHRIDLINSVKYIFESFNYLADNYKKDLLLYGDPHFDINKKKFILEATLFYIKITERFSGSLFEIPVKNTLKRKKRRHLNIIHLLIPNSLLIYISVLLLIF